MTFQFLFNFFLFLKFSRLQWYVNLKPFFQMQQSTVALNWIMKILQEQEKNTRVAPMLEDKRENGKLKLTISKNNLDLLSCLE